MLTLTSTEMHTWIAALLWPLTRILGMIAAAPLYGNNSVPISAKIILGVLIALILAPAIPAMQADLMSLAGLLIVIQELLIGAAIGFSMRIVFAAVEMAGRSGQPDHGPRFRQRVRPANAGRSSAVSQFLALVATMAFLSVNGHLVLLEVLAESFVTLPVSATPISAAAPYALVKWGGVIFSVGLQLCLPIVAALLITNVALGILTRAAPQLNIFGIGFPISLGVGILVISMALPYLSVPLQNLFNQGIEAARSVPRSAAQRTL
ncbi:flagellar biosynthetic protein FliR [Massilia sp. B-10]|nr:flagellar biosynthetic protein FliR [Massilia sp. B-10]